MSIFTKEYWTKESIDKRIKANKEKTKKYHEKLYPKKNNDAIKVNKLKNSGAVYVQSVGGGKDFKDVKVIGENTYNEKMKAFSQNDETGENTVPDARLATNPLHNFSSVNHKITLAVMDASEVNYPGLVLKNGPKYPVAQTAGKTGGEIIAADKGGRNLEFLIDNLDVRAIVSHNPKSRGTQNTTVEFDVIEPYSMGLFFQALKVQSVKAYGPDADYIHVPFCLIVDFVGYDDEGEKVSPAGLNELAKLKRVIPIALRQVQLGASQAGGRYSCVGYPWNERNMRDANVTCKKDMTISGRNVAEILQYGERSLMNMLNKKIGGKAKKKGEPEENVEYNQTAIMFPNPFGLDHEDLVPSADVIGNMNEDRAAVTNFGGAGDESVYSLFETRKEDTQLKNLFSVGGNKVNVTNLMNTKGAETGDAGGLNLNQFSNGKYAGNVIGAAPMLDQDESLEQAAKKFADPEKVYNKKKDLVLTNKISGNVNKGIFTMHVEKGTKVTDVIETIIVFSKYGKELLEAQKKKKSPFLPWFRIHPQCWQLKDTFVFKKTNMHPQIFAYNIVPYKIHESAGGGFVDPTDFTKGQDLLRETVYRKYNYIYTGLNEDILNFDLNYQFSFYDLQRERPSSNSNRSFFPGQGLRIETDALANRNTTFKINDNTGKKDGIKDGAGASETQSQNEDSPLLGMEFSSPETQIAFQFNERIMNSQVDLLNLTLTIVGDTYFLPNSGMGNLVILNHYADNTKIEFGKREMDYLNGMCHVEVFFTTPVDIDEASGDMKAARFVDEASGTSVQLGTFSAIYRVTQVQSTFRGGKFTQDLTLVAPQSLQIREKHRTTDSPKISETNNNADETLVPTDGSNYGEGAG